MKRGGKHPVAYARVLALGAVLFVGAATTAGSVLGVAAAGAAAAAASTSTAAGPPITAPCGTAAPGTVTCLVHVFHPGRGMPDDTPAGRARPQNAGPQTSTPTGLSPTQILDAYGYPKGGGAGETIAIVDAYADPTIAANLATFSTYYKLPACTAGCFTKVGQTGGTAPTRKTAGWDLETSLDVEWAHAIAPKASILLVEATTTSFANMFAAVTYAATHASYVSMSWGSTSETSGESAYDKYFAGHGTDSFFAASGDSPSQVGYPSSSPDVVSVGGTTLTVTASGTWVSETAWATAGGGCSKVESASTAQATYPTYGQAGCDGYRATPDISLDANPNTGVAVYDTTEVTGYVDWIQVGGTSAATVMTASRAAVSGQHIDATTVYGHDFPIYNVTSGSNGHPCETGYNLCTGLGTWSTARGSEGSLAFTTSPQELAAGSPVELSIESTPAASGDVTLTSTSATGEFAATDGGQAGPFSSTPTLAVPLSGGGATFYYEDTTAGSPQITASAPGYAAAEQTETVTALAGTVSRLSVSPTSASLASGATQAFTVTAYDRYGNAWTGFDATWAVAGTIGKLSSATGSSVTLTAGSSAASGEVTASTSGGAHSASATVTVTTEPTVKVTLTAGTEETVGKKYEVPLSVTATGTSSKAISGGAVALDVYSGSCTTGALAASGTSKTSPAGKVTLTFTTATTGTYCAKATVSASGYASGTATASFTVSATSKATRSGEARGQASIG